MASPWQRHLLVASGVEGEEGGGGFMLETWLVASALIMVLLLLLLQCACKDNGAYNLVQVNRSKKEEGERKGASKKNGASTKASSMVADPAVVTVDIPEEGEATNAPSSTVEVVHVGNGSAQGARNGVSPSGHSRNASSGSGQMRPTSLRELPDLPVGNHKRNLSGAGVVDNTASSRNAVDNKEDDDNAYDHLGAKITTNSSAAANYDHITLESPRDLSSGTTPLSDPDTASEGHYAQVRERTYDVVKDVHPRASAKVSSEYDPYAKVKDVEDEKEDPYAKVKDTEKDDGDDDYAHLKHDHVITPAVVTASRVVADDEEDPYERVMGDSAGAHVLAPAASVDPDDPYSIVSEATTTVVAFPGAASAPAKPTPTTPATPREKTNSNQNNSTTRLDEHFHLQYADEDGEAQDDYATVVKDRNPSSSRVVETQAEGGREGEAEEIDPYFVSPPEPPRLYGASEIGRLPGAVAMVAGGAGVVDTGEDATQRRESKEHRYTKVTARESLASMNARNALNTYEVVPDLPENTYATVEGGSGDGMVRYATPSTPNLQHSVSEMSETYAEIGASASGGYATPAPEPPSLDSLHSMTKSTSSNDGDRTTTTATTPTATASNVLMSDDGYALVSKGGFSPSETALPQIPRADASSNSIGSLGSLGGEERTIAGVTLHPDYHSVKDCLLDNDNDNDPNYESVDEAWSRVPGSGASPSAVVPVHSSTSTSTSPRVTIINHTSPARVNHQYEEVSPPSSPVASPTSVVIGAAAATVSSNGASSNGTVPKVENSGNAEAVEVRDRVLQGHMYEDISEVKKRNSGSQRKSGTEKKGSEIQSVKL